MTGSEDRGRQLWVELRPSTVKLLAVRLGRSLIGQDRPYIELGRSLGSCGVGPKRLLA
jgi:hypothetical protein